jgi:hypothetical protein
MSSAIPIPYNTRSNYESTGYYNPSVASQPTYMGPTKAPTGPSPRSIPTPEYKPSTTFYGDAEFFFYSKVLPSLSAAEIKKYTSRFEDHLQHVFQVVKPALPTIARFLLVSTFYEDFIRIMYFNFCSNKVLNGMTRSTFSTLLEVYITSINI